MVTKTDYINAVAKLIALTQDQKLVWAPVQWESSVAFAAQLELKRVKLLIYSNCNNFQPTLKILLGSLPIFSFPEMSIVSDLFSSVQRQAVGGYIDEFFFNLLKSEVVDES